jgi:choline monooxygenase
LLVFRERVDYALDANWKIAVENYLECYHCPVAHRGLSALIDVDPDAYVLKGEGSVWSQYPAPANLSIGPVWPTSPGRTVGFLDYFLGPDVDEAWARELIAFNDLVGEEDRTLVESVQRDVTSGLVSSGRLLPESERLIALLWAKVALSLNPGDSRCPIWLLPCAS